MTTMFQKLDSNEFDALADLIDLKILAQSISKQKDVEDTYKDVSVYSEIIQVEP